MLPSEGGSSCRLEREMQSEEFDNNTAQSHPVCGTVRVDIFESEEHT